MTGHHVSFAELVTSHGNHITLKRVTQVLGIGRRRF
jgi:hypothetical protein